MNELQTIGLLMFVKGGRAGFKTSLGVIATSFSVSCKCCFVLCGFNNDCRSGLF